MAIYKGIDAKVTRFICSSLMSEIKSDAMATLGCILEMRRVG